MLTLLLLRHAKAEAGGHGDDFSRKLTEQGERDANAVGDFLRSHDLRPDLALLSTAERTIRTGEIVLRLAACRAEVRKEAGFYNASSRRLLDHLSQIGNGPNTVMVLAHNPGIMDLAADLASEGDLSEMDRLKIKFPPCSLAVLSFHANDWETACASGGRLDALIFPEDL